MDLDLTPTPHPSHLMVQVIASVSACRVSFASLLLFVLPFLACLLLFVLPFLASFFLFHVPLLLLAVPFPLFSSHAQVFSSL